MKKILIAFMLLLSTTTMAQRLSVLGIEMGTGIGKAERILNERFGEFNVHRTGYTELGVYNALVGGTKFSSVDFEFQYERRGDEIYTYLYFVDMQNHFNSYDNAKSMFNSWEEKLGNKYTATTIKDFYYDNQEDIGFTIWYEEGVALHLSYGKSKGGDFYWYVHVTYHQNFIDESNDY